MQWLTPEVRKALDMILDRGGVAEIKRERDKVVVVNIERKVTCKDPVVVISKDE